jgi:hypothetical protein
MDHKMFYLARRNPAISPEDWPRAWRAHPRFVSQFPLVSSVIQRLSYCSRVYEPRLNGERFDPPGATQDYDGAAVVGSPDENLHTNTVPPDIHAKIMDDERRAFAALTPTCTVRGRETLVVGGKPGMSAVLRFLRRKPGTSRADFDAAWAARQTGAAERAVAEAKVDRYVHTAILQTPPPGYEFDGVSETWFQTVDDAVRSFVDPSLAPLTEGLAEFCDMDGSVTMLTEVIYRLPRE